MEGLSDDFPIIKAFKNNQFGKEKAKEDQENNKYFDE